MLQLLSQVPSYMQAADAVPDEGVDAARWGHHAASGDDGPVVVPGEPFQGQLGMCLTLEL